MFADDDGRPCPTCRTVHEPYATEVCAISQGAPTTHGYEMYTTTGCTCIDCRAGCEIVRARAQHDRAAA